MATAVLSSEVPVLRALSSLPLLHEPGIAHCSDTPTALCNSVSGEDHDFGFRKYESRTCH